MLEYMQKNGYAVNRASLKQVYLDNKSYLKKFDAGKLGIKENGYESWENVKDDFAEITPSSLTKEQGQAWYDGLPKITRVISGNNKEFARLDTFMGFPVYLDNKTMQHLLEGDRQVYISQLTKALQDPDECYLNAPRGAYIMKYISYYKDKPFVVVASVSKDNVLEIDSWYQINDRTDKEIDNHFRAGVPCKKKNA